MIQQKLEKNACPVCPYTGLDDNAIKCPNCGTDLTPLRRVRELPSVLFNEGISRAREGDLEHAINSLQAASVFPGIRPMSLLLLGKCEAQRGNLDAACHYWEEPASAGIDEATRCLKKAELLKLKTALRQSTASVACPNPSCKLRNQKGNGNISLKGVYGASHTPLWRCDACKKTFSGNRDSLAYRLRMPRTKAFQVVAELLRGKAPGQIALENGCSRQSVLRMARRAIQLGPMVIQEVITEVHCLEDEPQRGWRAFVKKYRRKRK